jgi:hypothetical protein
MLHRTKFLPLECENTLRIHGKKIRGKLHSIVQSASFFVTEKAGFEPELIVTKSIVACVSKFRVAGRVAHALFVHFLIGTKLIVTNQFRIPVIFHVPFISQ